MVMFGIHSPSASTLSQRLIIVSDKPSVCKLPNGRLHRPDHIVGEVGQAGVEVIGVGVGAGVCDEDNLTFVEAVLVLIVVVAVAAVVVPVMLELVNGADVFTVGATSSIGLTPVPVCLAGNGAGI